METSKRWAGAGVLVALCAAPFAPTADAAGCHEVVAGGAYSCTAADGLGSEPFGLQFDVDGGTAIALGNQFVCFCSSTGASVEGLKNEAGRNIVCLRVLGGDELLVFSALATGKRLTQGTFATLHEFDVDPDRTVFLSCER
jgi:hypothetical protein